MGARAALDADTPPSLSCLWVVQMSIGSWASKGAVPRDHKGPLRTGSEGPIREGALRITNHINSAQGKFVTQRNRTEVEIKSTMINLSSAEAKNF